MIHLPFGDSCLVRIAWNHFLRFKIFRKTIFLKEDIRPQNVAKPRFPETSRLPSHFPITSQPWNITFIYFQKDLTWQSTNVSKSNVSCSFPFRGWPIDPLTEGSCGRLTWPTWPTWLPPSGVHVNEKPGEANPIRDIRSIPQRGKTQICIRIVMTFWGLYAVLWRKVEKRSNWIKQVWKMVGKSSL